MRQLKWLFICLSVLLTISLVFKFGCTTEEYGKTGFDIVLAVTGMKRVTSVSSVINALQKIDALVIDDATYKVIGATLPFGRVKNESPVTIKYPHHTEKVKNEMTKPVLENKIGWNLKPNEPKYFIVQIRALAGADPTNGVNEVISERVKAALIEAIEKKGFEARVESIEAREGTSTKRYTFGSN